MTHGKIFANGLFNPRPALQSSQDEAGLPRPHNSCDDVDDCASAVSDGLCGLSAMTQKR